MSPVDIETFLAIKRQIVRVRWLQAAVASLALIGVVAAILLLNRGHREVLDMALGAAIAGAVLTIGSRSDRARDQLVEILEKQINRDPAALRYLAQEHLSR